MKTFIIVFTTIVLGSIVFHTVGYLHTETKTCVITGKERITKKSGDSFDSFYLVYTDKGTMKLEDDVLRGNWNSSDVYGGLKVDSTYTIQSSGFRIGFFSMYPNIINVK